MCEMFPPAFLHTLVSYCLEKKGALYGACWF
jgi:hypothetical protein